MQASNMSGLFHCLPVALIGHQPNRAGKLLVALATCTLVGEVHPPLQGKQRAGIVQAKKMDDWDEWDGEQVLVPVGAPWPGPLLEGVMELLRVPAELALDQQVHS